MVSIVGYTADADTFCVADAIKNYPGLEDEDARVEDSEGNEVRPIFDLDEAGDTPTHCAICHELIGDSWSGATVEYAEQAVREYLETGSGNVEVLSAWVEHAGFDDDLAEAFTARTAS